MNIVIDARMLTWTGIGRYTWNLLDQLQEIDTDTTHDYTVLLLKKDFDTWNPKTSNIKKVVADFQPYSVQEQLLLPIFLYKLKPDLVHFTHFTAPLFYFGRRVVTVHDLTLVYFKTNQGEGLKKWIFEVKYWAMRLVLRAAVIRSQVITDTEFVRQQLLERYGRGLFKLKQSKVSTILLSVDPLMAEPKQPENFDEKTQFLLYVGNYYPNKNISRLLEAYKLTRTKYPDLKLVLVGKADYFQQQVQARAKMLQLDEKVFFAGFVPDDELVWYFKHTAAYVFPSLSEGFGLPALEAMAQGAPVIAANASCLPEVCGEAAVYFDPEKPADIADKVMGVLQNAALRERLAAAGPEHIKKFDRRRTAEETLAVYNRALKPATFRYKNG